MQFSADMTIEELKEDREPLVYADFPLNRLTLVKEFFEHTLDIGSKNPKNYSHISSESIDAALFMIGSAIDEIKVINEAVAQRLEDLEDSRDDLAEKLKSFIPAIDLAEKMKVHPSRIVASMVKDRG